jgi:hypothetical protein
MSAVGANADANRLPAPHRTDAHDPIRTYPPAPNFNDAPMVALYHAGFRLTSKGTNIPLRNRNYIVWAFFAVLGTGCEMAHNQLANEMLQ